MSELDTMFAKYMAQAKDYATCMKHMGSRKIAAIEHGLDSECLQNGTRDQGNPGQDGPRKMNLVVSGYHQHHEQHTH